MRSLDELIEWAMSDEQEPDVSEDEARLLCEWLGDNLTREEMAAVYAFTAHVANAAIAEVTTS